MRLIVGALIVVGILAGTIASVQAQEADSGLVAICLRRKRR